MKKLNKAQKIEKMLSAGATVAEIMGKLKVARGYIYVVKQKMKVKKPIVKLTATQVALANKLGVSKEAYARELVTAGSAKITPATAAWLERNPWFGKDRDKTAFALHIHEKLVKKGVDPQSDKYYKKVDASVRYFDTRRKLYGKEDIKSAMFAAPEALPKELKVGTELGGLVLTSPEKGKYLWVRKDPVDTPDMVNHPPHYEVGGIEVIDFIEAKQLGYNLGNVVRYVSRAGKKSTDALQDLQKARWYLERAIQRTE